MDNTETAFWQRMQYAANYFTDAAGLVEGGSGDKWLVSFCLVQSCSWLGLCYSDIPSNDTALYLEFVRLALVVVQEELAKMIQI